MSEKTHYLDKVNKFSEWLLSSEMLLAQAMVEEPGEYETAFGWLNHVRHEFDRTFKEN